MSTTEIFRDASDGHDVVGLRSPEAELRVMPGLGARIVSLVDRRTGREWLWRKPGAEPLRPSRLGDAFERGPMAGVDECLPSVAPCVVAGRTIPDHGEVWSTAWSLDESRLCGNEILTRVTLPTSPLAFERSLRLDGPNVHLRYRLTNLSDVAQPYLWAFHPLIATVDGDRIELPATVSEVVIDSSQNVGGRAGERWSWPRPKAGIDLAAIDLGADRSYLKCFVARMPVGGAAIRNGRTGEGLTFEFDVAELPSLGVWITRGGWNGYHHVALEPTNAPTDSLADALSRGLCRTLLPRGTRTWSLTLSLSS